MNEAFWVALFLSIGAIGIVYMEVARQCKREYMKIMLIHFDSEVMKTEK